MLPWAAFCYFYPINDDIAILTSLADIMLDGGKIGIDYYDSNPPFSIVLYAPVVLLHDLTGLSLHISALVWSAAWVVWAVWTSALLLRLIFPQHPQDRIVILSSFILAATILSSTSFGERDHIVALALFPFSLLQFCYFRNIKVPRLLQALILIPGTFVILVKPHHGLFPTIFLVARLIRNRNFFGFYRQPDFIALALGVLLYIAIVAIFFSAFITTILSDVLAYYVPESYYRTNLLKVIAVPVLTLPFWLVFQRQNISSERREISNLLALGAVLSAFCFFIQGKGFYYHLLPAVTFLACLGSYGLYVFLPVFLKKNIGPTPALALAAVIFYIITPFPATKVLYTDLQNLPLKKILTGSCPQSPCPFFIITYLNIIYLDVFYFGDTHAVRMPGPWFLPTVLEKIHYGSPEEKAKAQAVMEKYKRYYAEDLLRNKPDVIILPKIKGFDVGETPFFKEILLSGEAFEKIWRNYEDKGPVKIRPSDYYDSATHPAFTEDYQLYIRKPD